MPTPRDNAVRLIQFLRNTQNVQIVNGQLQVTSTNGETLAIAASPDSPQDTTRIIKQRRWKKRVPITAAEYPFKLLIEEDTGSTYRIWLAGDRDPVLLLERETTQYQIWSIGLQNLGAGDNFIAYLGEYSFALDSYQIYAFSNSFTPTVTDGEADTYIGGGLLRLPKVLTKNNNSTTPGSTQRVYDSGNVVVDTISYLRAVQESCDDNPNCFDFNQGQSGYLTTPVTRRVTVDRSTGTTTIKDQSLDLSWLSLGVTVTGSQVIDELVESWFERFTAINGDAPPMENPVPDPQSFEFIEYNSSGATDVTVTHPNLHWHGVFQKTTPYQGALTLTDRVFTTGNAWAVTYSDGATQQNPPCACGVAWTVSNGITTSPYASLLLNQADQELARFDYSLPVDYSTNRQLNGVYEQRLKGNTEDVRVSVDLLLQATVSENLLIVGGVKQSDTDSSSRISVGAGSGLGGVPGSNSAIYRVDEYVATNNIPSVNRSDTEILSPTYNGVLPRSPNSYTPRLRLDPNWSTLIGSTCYQQPFNIVQNYDSSGADFQADLEIFDFSSDSVAESEEPVKGWSLANPWYVAAASYFPN